MIRNEPGATVRYSGCSLAIVDGGKGFAERQLHLSSPIDSDARFGRFLSMSIEVCALPLLDRFCSPAKSLAADLCAPRNIIEAGASHAAARPGTTVRHGRHAL